MTDPVFVFQETPTLATEAATARAAESAAQAVADAAASDAAAALGRFPITETDIADGAISTPKLAANAVTANEIAAGTITAAEIAAGAITAAQLSADAIDGKTITGATIRTSGAVDQSCWEITSSPANEIRGIPAANPNTPTPGVLLIGSTQTQILPNPRYMYEVILRPPRSALTPTASDENPKLRLVAHEGTGATSVVLVGDAGQVGSSSTTGPRLSWDSAAGTLTASKPIGVLNGSVPETWHVVGTTGEPLFAGNWAISGGITVAFYKDATGRVQLRGNATEPVASSTTIFVLPAGYRPTQTMSWAVKANNDAASVCWVQVTTTGQVNVIGNVAAARVQTILDAISFPTF